MGSDGLLLLSPLPDTNFLGEQSQSTSRAAFRIAAASTVEAPGPSRHNPGRDVAGQGSVF